MRVLVKIGINYPDGNGGEKRAEPGAEVVDVPVASIPDLVAIGAVEVIEEVRRGARGR